MRQHLHHLAVPTKQATSTLLRRHIANKIKITAMYRHFDVAGDLDLMNLDWFHYNRNTI